MVPAIEKVVISKAATSDLASAYNWYEQEKPGLGTDFLSEVKAAISRASGRPELYPVVVQNVRRVLTQRFPYAVYYRVRGNSLRILAVVHQHRDPRTWRRRIDR